VVAVLKPVNPSIATTSSPFRQAAGRWFEPLPDDLEAEIIEAAERGQVGGSEGSVRHVEVFRMGCVGTPILGGPRPLPEHRRAARYTLNCDEPTKSHPTSA
jgi:hypothetical protein